MFDEPQTQANDGVLPEFGENLGSAAGVAPLPSGLVAGMAAYEVACHQGMTMACSIAHAMVGGYFAAWRLVLGLPQS